MVREIGVALVLALLLPVAGDSADANRWVVSHAEPPFAAKLVGIGSDWELQFVVAGETRTLAAKEIAYWGRWADQYEQTVCLLADGGILTAVLAGVTEQELIVESQLWRRTVLPRQAVRGLMLQPSLDAGERDQLRQRIYAHAAAHDRLWLANGDELTGRLAALPGGQSVDLFGLDVLSFQLPGAAEPMVIQTRNIVALALAADVESAPARASGTAAYVAFRDGACLEALSAEQREGQVSVRLVGNVSLSADANQFFDQITLVQPLHSDVVYLSSLPAVSYRHVPFVDGNWLLGRDQSVTGGLLRSGENVYRRGLGMHSTSRAVYDLGGQYRRFAAELALDAQAGRQGSVVYRVFLESPGSGSAATWRLVYESPVVRGGAVPLLMSVDLQNARRIALVVDFADHGDTRDHANWLNARLLRQ